jgi:hypothetical protein
MRTPLTGGGHFYPSPTSRYLCWTRLALVGPNKQLERWTKTPPGFHRCGPSDTELLLGVCSSRFHIVVIFNQRKHELCDIKIASQFPFLPQPFVLEDNLAAGG